MPRPRRFRPSVEPLGGRTPPSSSPLRLLGPLGALVEDAITPDPLSISGRLRGTAQGRPPAPTAGAALDLAGAGRVGTLGQVQFTGSLQGVGSLRHGRAGGSLNLYNEHGTATLRLLGPAQRAGARLPNRFRFVVRQGGQENSGPLKGNLGTVRFTPRPAPGQVALVLRSEDESS